MQFVRKTLFLYCKMSEVNLRLSRRTHSHFIFSVSLNVIVWDSETCISSHCWWWRCMCQSICCCIQIIIITRSVPRWNTHHCVAYNSMNRNFYSPILGKIYTKFGFRLEQFKCVRFFFLRLVKRKYPLLISIEFG